MDKRFSKRWAGFNISMIGIIYLISGVWEILLLAQGEGYSFYLLNIYHYYVVALGVMTVVVGIGLLSKVNTFRILALVLAWWNLFTAPIIDVWWYIYMVNIKKVFIGSPGYIVVIQTFLLLSILSAIRLYIIYMLRLDKAGYLFIKNPNSSLDGRDNLLQNEK